MRDVKFRGKVKSSDPIISKRWAYGGLFYTGSRTFSNLRAFIVLDDCEILTCSDIGATKPDFYISDFIEVDPETVGQFTGLKDKNGKDLDWWEGDLFNVYATIRKIVFEDGCYWFRAVFPSKVVHQKLVCINVINASDILPEKIGNIHSNPELLAEKK